MFRIRAIIALTFITAVSAFFTSEANADRDWYPYMIARGQDRVWIQNLPIEMRPNRPFHFYGNAVRRQIDDAPIFSTRPIRMTIRGRRAGR